MKIVDVNEGVCIYAHVQWHTFFVLFFFYFDSLFENPLWEENMSNSEKLLVFCLHGINFVHCIKIRFSYNIFNYYSPQINE